MTAVWKLAIFVYDSFCRRFGLGEGRVGRSRRLALSRDEIALVVLSLAGEGTFAPVQIQKALFLASDKVRDAFDRHSQYDFQPYDYGPFDWQVYADIENLERRGLARIFQMPGERWRTYAATDQGRFEGQKLTRRLRPDQLEVLQKIVNLVRSLSFNDLVSAIYRGYPEMRARSVFRH